MAKLHKFTVQEAVNTDVAGVWDVQGVTSTGAVTLNLEVTNYHNIIIDCTLPIMVLFNNTTDDDCSATDDIILPTGVHSLKIPHGIGTASDSKVHLHWRSSDSSTATARIVLT